MKDVERDPKNGCIVASCVVALLGIVGIAPVFGMAAAMNSDYCFENEAIVCSHVGRGVVVIAPAAGAIAGLLLAVASGLIPRLRRFRVRCLLAGYGLASAGFVVSFVLARAAP